MYYMEHNIIYNRIAKTCQSLETLCARVLWRRPRRHRPSERRKLFLSAALCLQSHVGLA